MSLVSEFLKGRQARNPLNSIPFFLSPAGLFGYCGLQSSEGIQAILFGAMVTWPVVVFGGFLYVWIRHPENLYAPLDYVKGEVFAKIIKQKRRSLDKDLRERTIKPEPPQKNERQSVKWSRKDVKARRSRSDTKRLLGR